MKKEIMSSLWKEYVNKADFNKMQKRNLEMLGMNLQDDIDFLYELITLFKGNFEPRESKNTGIKFEYDENLYILRRENTGIFLPKEKMKQIIIDMIDLFEEILPLGTVVDLKKINMKKQFDLSMIENFRVIITRRFIGLGKDIFYPYAGSLYPLGILGEGRVISFTSSMIERVVYKGFQDQMEEQFVGLMKREMIINRGRKAAGFCSAEELQAVREEMEALELNGRTQ